EVNGITAREREEEEDKERADEIGERLDEVRREQHDRWKSQMHDVGIDLTDEEWDDAADTLSDPAKRERLRQNMMQKNLSCRNIGEAQKNMVSFSLVLVFVNLVFLSLGALLFLYVERFGVEMPLKPDQLYPMLATDGSLPVVVGLLFILGLIAAAYSSADSALTALTTSVCVDVLEIEKRPEAERVPLRIRVHVIMSIVMVILILLFKVWNDDSVIKTVFRVAGYTYGPLLGLFAFGMLTKTAVHDRWVPLIAVLSPIITFVLDTYSIQLFGGYKFGFELLLVNGAITMVGLALLSRRG
ncbi:MAG TPA: hypothetical protein PLX64_08135, partial [Flavobacteriales bacterium]|nr:hypothetical protein [Flavobacteriales bacterium]